MTRGATVRWSYHRCCCHATRVAGTLTTDHRRRKKLYQGVRKGEAMTYASLASSESSSAMNFGRLGVPSALEARAEEGEGRELVGPTRFGPWLRPGPTRDSLRERERERRVGPSEPLGQFRWDRVRERGEADWAASVAGPNQEG
jgi:hypothetical protein